MHTRAVPGQLSERLGLEAATNVVELLEKAERDMTENVLGRSVDRFERRLAEGISSLRLVMLQGDAALSQEIQSVRIDLRDQKAELLKWSFLFWAGQLAAMAALFRLTGR